MKLKEIINQLESLAPPSLQENYDNSGLIVGDSQAEISSILFCLDSTEEVLDEAIKKGANLIVAHHPIVFNGLKSLTGKTYIERVLLKAIKNEIAIYAIHTNLDNVVKGVNGMIASRLNLKNTKILSPKKALLTKLVFFCPKDKLEEVRIALFERGAGHIGNYDSCSFNLEGEGTFRASEEANPYVGEIGMLHQEAEIRTELVLPNYLIDNIVQTLKEVHPYEEVAYDLYPLQNTWDTVGSGMIGELEKEIAFEDFLKSLKSTMNTELIRYTKPHKSKVKKVALCGGSGSFLLNDAIRQNADVFISGDFKYHQFFDADGKIVIADIGHFESEQFTPRLLKAYLEQKFPNFALYLSEVNTNPINYL